MNYQIASGIAHGTCHYNDTNDYNDEKVAQCFSHTLATGLTEAYNLDLQQTSLILDIHTMVNY